MSGVNRQLHPGQVLHYRRRIFVGEALESAETVETAETTGTGRIFLPEGGHYLLHFGAVDQICSVYWNGKFVGSHEGGYLPFTFDVTAFLQPGENELALSVRDFSDTSWYARGKQKLQNGGMWYTAQSGIWQTVWLEYVPRKYIRQLKLTPCYDAAVLKLKIMTNRASADTGGENGTLHAENGGMREANNAAETDPENFASVKVSLRGIPITEAEFPVNRTSCIPLPGFESWSPENPVLYDLEITYGQDRVSSYFAMRKISVEKEGSGIPRFYLNNQPYFHNGLLDQGYYPDGLYTAPSDEALQADIRKMKDLGFNMLRKHIKVEPDRWYYHCDRIGMLVWQDMVNGGTDYHMHFVCTMPNVAMWTNRIIPDSRWMYRLFSRQDAAGRAAYYRELKEMIQVLYNHPCIVQWTPFNEGWGQFDAAKASKLVRKLDPSRLIDEASGWFDQGGGDMYSIHNYFRPIRVKPQKDGRVAALTEYGGYACRIPDHSYCETVYGYRKYNSQEALTRAMEKLWEKGLIPAAGRGLGAAVYTQVSDIEEETNGLLTYDRKVVKVDEERIRRINEKLLALFKASSSTGLA